MVAVIANAAARSWTRIHRPPPRDAFDRAASSACPRRRRRDRRYAEFEPCAAKVPPARPDRDEERSRAPCRLAQGAPLHRFSRSMSRSSAITASTSGNADETASPSFWLVSGWRSFTDDVVAADNRGERPAVSSFRHEWHAVRRSMRRMPGVGVPPVGTARGLRPMRGHVTVERLPAHARRLRSGIGRVMRSTSPAIQPRPGVTSYSRPRSAKAACRRDAEEQRPSAHHLLSAATVPSTTHRGRGGIGEGADAGRRTTRRPRRRFPDRYVTTDRLVDAGVSATRSTLSRPSAGLPRP